MKSSSVTYVGWHYCPTLVNPAFTPALQEQGCWPPGPLALRQSSNSRGRMTCLSVYPLRSLLQSTQLQSYQTATREKSLLIILSRCCWDKAIKPCGWDMQKAERVQSHATPHAPPAVLLQRLQVAADNGSQKLCRFLLREGESTYADTTASHVPHLTERSSAISLAIHESLCKLRQQSHH